MWADAIETLTLLGELDRAHSYLDEYERSAHRLQSPDAMAAAARLRALLAATEGDLGGAVTAAEHAMAILDGFSYPFERGRVLLTLGSVLRQGHQQIGTPGCTWASPRDLRGDRCTALGGKARDELRRISGRRPADFDDLTDTELQVATLAATGRSNKEIASAMYLGVSTVEAHLSHVYRKLGAHRAKLATRLLALHGDDVTPPASPHSS